MVAAIDTSSCSTVSDLLGTLDSYGFEYSIDDGIISISNEANEYYLADTALTQSLGFITDSGDATSTSARFTKETYDNMPTYNNLLSDLGITNGTLNISSSLHGNSTFTITSESTLRDFQDAVRSAIGGICLIGSMLIISGLNQEITFSSADSNIVDILDIDGENAKYNYHIRSENLYEPTYTPVEISGTTKLVDITGYGDSEVNDFALETGYYHIFTPD